MNSKIITIIIISSLLLTVGVIWAVNKFGGNEGEINTGTGEELTFTWGLDSREDAEVLTEELKENASGLPVYKHESPDFTFNYPKELSVGSFPEGDVGEMILVQHPTKQVGFQIFIIPFSEDPATLTSERLRRELGMSVHSPQDVLIHGEGKGLTFIEGNMREVWFAARGYLYQVSAPIASENLVSEVLMTWRFE